MTEYTKFGSTNEQKKMINKMKHDLEQWREIILHVDAVLKWEKKFFPAIIFGVNSLLFLIVWYLDFSMLTMAALTVLFVAQMDYVFPFVSKILFKPNNWTGVQEKKFEDICSELCLLQCRLCSMYSYVFSAKEEKSTMFYIATSLALIVLAYVGAIIDNLLLTYLTCTFLAFYPGLLQQGFVHTLKDKTVACLSTYFKCIMQKTIDGKKAE